MTAAPAGYVLAQAIGRARADAAIAAARDAGRPVRDVPEIGGCLWIDSERDDPDWPTQCGEDVAPGRPYCLAHCLLAYHRLDGGPFSPAHFLPRGSGDPAERAA